MCLITILVRKLLATLTLLDISLYATPEENLGQQFDEVVAQDEE